MDLVAGYNSDDSSSDNEVVSKPAAPAKRSGASSSTLPIASINAAPEVTTEDLSVSYHLFRPDSKELTHNVPYEELQAQVLGPQHPYKQGKLAQRNVMTGFVEQHAMTDQTFAALRKNYDSVGYTLDPSGAGQVVRMSGGKQVVVEGQDVGLEVLSKQGLGNKDKKGVEAGKKRLKNGDPSDVNGYLGPWAGYEGEVRGEISGPTEEELKAAGFETLDGEGGAAGGSGAEKGKEKDFAAGSERTIFHGKSERDYLGRTYMHPPSDVDVNLLGEPGSQECSLPKRLLHTYTGHNNGVNAIRFLPKTAHLLLSAGMEGKAKLWDVYHDRQCLRTFIGHTKAIRDICFNNAGTQFLTASYDRWIKLWDTETGQCIKTFTTHKTPYCVRFHPEEDKQHIFLTGCSDKKVHQFDMNTGEVIQEYDQHLGAVNTITFVDDNRRFITTSDDKTLRAWEYDIPVVIKYVADPTMHSMPAVTLSPNKKWLSCQSLDNAVYIYSARDRFRLNRKKRFTGHLVAGFACQTAFSPDGQFLTSGDSEGKVIFWDWKTCKIRSKFKAHDKVTIGCEWHPHETSKLATCSWDGTIKYWG